MANLHKLLGQTSFWIVNKYLARYFGDNDMALFISDMVDKQGYHTSQQSIGRGQMVVFHCREYLRRYKHPSKAEAGVHTGTAKTRYLGGKKDGASMQDLFQCKHGKPRKPIRNYDSKTSQTSLVKTTKL
jgi:hypothetical protein